MQNLERGSSRRGHMNKIANFEIQENSFYPRETMLARSLFDERSLTGCPSVTSRYCVETANSILKPFRPTDSSIILVF